MLLKCFTNIPRSASCLKLACLNKQFPSKTLIQYYSQFFYNKFINSNNYVHEPNTLKIPQIPHSSHLTNMLEVRIRETMISALIGEKEYVQNYNYNRFFVTSF